MSPQPSHWPRYPNRPPAEFTTSRKSPPSPNSPGHARSLWQLSGTAISLCYRRSGCQHICCNRATVRNIGKRIQAASAGSSAIWNRCLSKKRSGGRSPESAPIRQESSACTSSITPPRTPPSLRVRLGDGADKRRDLRLFQNSPFAVSAMGHLCPPIWLAISESCGPPQFPVTSATPSKRIGILKLLEREGDMVSFRSSRRKAATAASVSDTRHLA